MSAGLPPIDPPEYHGPNVFEVEKIKAKRRDKGKLKYLVVWKGYPDPSENTWETVTHLTKCGCKKSINDFERSYFPPYLRQKGRGGMQLIVAILVAMAHL